MEVAAMRTEVESLGIGENVQEQGAVRNRRSRNKGEKSKLTFALFSPRVAVENFLAKGRLRGRLQPVEERKVEEAPNGPHEAAKGSIGLFGRV